MYVVHDLAERIGTPAQGLDAGLELLNLCRERERKRGRERGREGGREGEREGGREGERELFFQIYYSVVYFDRFSAFETQ